MARLLIIDASLNKRIATDLKKRGRLTVSAAELGLKDAKDPQLLAVLGSRTDDWMLVTADDNLPAAHPVDTATSKATIATIDPRIPPEFGLDTWFFEVVHRWAHAMEQQPKGSIRRYSATKYGLWTRRRR